MAAYDGRMATPVSPQVLRDWADVSVAGLEALRGEINDLNVFPIPDSDTGSNMLFTMRAAAEAAGALPDDDAVSLADIARAMADAAVAAARGNSGIILSQILVGVADAAEILADSQDAGFKQFAATGLRLGSLGAVRAVSEPREGTVLTIIRVAAETAAAHESDSAGDLARAVADDAADALERTPEQMPELASAGVVDAGGRGFLVLLDAMVTVLTGVSHRRRRYKGIVSGPAHEGVEACSGAGDMDFEVMYMLTGPVADRIASLREQLSAIGDSVVIVGDSSGDQGERFSVHVHTCDPGAAVEAGARSGTIADVRISCFALDAMRSQMGPTESPPRHRRAVIAVVRGDGAAELFADEGATVVRADGGLDPEMLAAAIRAADSAHVVVMANGALSPADLISVAAEVSSPQRTVVSLPTSSMAQCLAALAVHDPAENADVDAYAMAEAVAGARWGSLRRADTKMMTLAGMCEVDDVLGLIGSDVLVVAPDQAGSATALVDLMLATGGEMVTVLTGTEVDQTVSEALEQHIRRSHPGVELVVYETGQRDDLLQVGIE